MDMIQVWLADLLASHDTLRTYTPYLTTSYTYLTHLRTLFIPFWRNITANPDLATIALLLLLLFISLKVLNMLYQTLLFWVRMAVRIAVWGSLGALALWVYNRGPEGVAEDVEFWWRVWGEQHEYWRERERMARMGKGRDASRWFRSCGDGGV